MQIARVEGIVMVGNAFDHNSILFWTNKKQNAYAHTHIYIL